MILPATIGEVLQKAGHASRFNSCLSSQYQQSTSLRRRRRVVRGCVFVLFHVFIPVNTALAALVVASLFAMTSTGQSHLFCCMA